MTLTARSFMRVLHVTPLYWPSLGGGEQVVHTLSERMARDRHEVTVVTTDAASVEAFWNRHGPRVSERDQLINGVRVVRVPIASFPLGQLGLFITRGLAIRAFDPFQLTRLVRRIGAWMPHAPQFRSTLNNLAGSFDLIHGFNLSWESCLVDACEFARATRRPYVMTPFMHTGEPGQTRVSRNYRMSHQQAALRNSDRVIVQTPIEARAIEAMGVDRSRIVEVGVGIDPDRIIGGDPDRLRARSGVRGPLAVFIGRVTRDKGAIALVQAMQQLWANGVEIECAMAGTIMPDFDRFLQAQPAMPRLHLLGPISDDDKRDLLAAADVVVMPSRAESFGIVYLEAWAYGKPVIGARAGGAADVISDGVDGYLVPFDDASSLASRIKELIADRELAHHMGEAGRAKLFARYTRDITYAKTMDVYRDVLK
jgi:glycogen(starch) synthase